MKLVVAPLLAAALLTISGPAGAAATQSATLARVVVGLKDGDRWGTWKAGIGCIVTWDKLTWDRKYSEFDVASLAEVVRDEFAASGLAKPVAQNLFEEEAPNGLQLGALITQVDAKLCSPTDNQANLLPGFKGVMTLGIDWQVYDPVRREVVGRVSTTGSGELKQMSDQGLKILLSKAFGANAHALAADPAFRALLDTPTSSAKAAPVATPQSSLAFKASTAAGKMPLAEAGKGVVAIFAGDAMGSGVLIGSDGYILTNHHVAGASGRVRVRWADGSEAPADVVRADKARDVALLKVATSKAQPLRIRHTQAELGETVYAIGTPLDEKLQNTVTRGIVSGSRLVQGHSFIQSDVPVTHGNSGGPLIDEQGAVLGLTDWGVDASEGSSLNFFIPIDDALKVLALQPAG